MYLGALCFEYAVTKDPDVRAEAWEVFDAMETLYTVRSHEPLQRRLTTDAVCFLSLYACVR